MRRRAPQLFAVAAVVVSLQGSSAQILSRPTPEPLVTAENERWYLEGEPIVAHGDVYYPSGPLLFFRPQEMVRSGDFHGIPLYARTTVEPYSIVYLPVGGGLMRPYERRRTGDLVGTTGSIAPSLPGDLPGVDPYTGAVAQAAAPPVLGRPLVGVPVGEVPLVTAVPVPAAVPTTGAEPMAVPLAPLRSARLPEGLDTIYVEYGGRRWMLDGSPVALDAARFTRVGEHAGFPVFRRAEHEATIYVSVSASGEGPLVPYTAKR